MAKRTIVIVASILLTIAVSLLLTQKFRTARHGPALTIGVLTTIPHPALDSAQEGFIKQVSGKFGSAVRFVMQSADGSAAQAQAIAQAFHANSDIKAILTLGSLATQAMARVEKNKPIFTAAVSDPWALNLDRQDNVCGSSDMINLTQYLDTLKKLLPDVRRIAIMFNPAEVNAVGMVEKMTPLLERENFTITKAQIQHESEIGQTMNFALSRADVIITPIDNTVASLVETISKQALKANKPLVVADALLVQKGAFAALSGIDYFKSGQAAGAMALSVLIDGKTPLQLGFAQAPSTKLVVNKKVMNTLKRSVPVSLTQDCIFVEK
ncbi:MAG: ABC transporter substrate-binding protein [Epsilonproteobacteria bacterium]|nr:ABC transporter substrate-binding protein [Campylobacterota bacterium]